jgi:hypothetical protein
VRCGLRDRRAILIATLYLAALLISAAASTPRRVGDGGEYFVMALQLASGSPPSLSPDDLQQVRGRLQQLGGGFESSLLDYPDLVASDGRQDFLHFFLYSLIVAPAVVIVGLVNLHPNWAFTFVNALLLAGACFVVARRAPLVVCVAAFVGPIVWWVDKAHTEAFLFAMISVAAVTFAHAPALALIAFAMAGAQNAAIGVTYPAFAGMVWLATRRSTFTRGTFAAAIAGAALVAAPFVYTWVRLGRWSPMVEYAQRIVPSPGGVAAFVLEPNIGLLPHAPVYAVSLIGALWMLLEKARNRSVPAYWWWPAVIHFILLAAWSQNPNANHGGTPGVNRWVLSLIALGLPWIAAARHALPAGGRVALNMAVAIAAVMSAAAHLPSRPENYREPTALAKRMWSAGWVQVTPAEVFAERTSGREPALLPTQDGGCRILLIADQQAPASCAPPTEPLPSRCRAAGAMCYAIVAGDTSRYVPAPNNGFFYRVADASWPAGGPLAAGMHRVLREADPAARVWRLENRMRWRDRLPGLDVGAVLRSGDIAVIYIPRATDEARRALAADGHQVIPLIPPAETSNLAVVIRR